MWHKLKAAQSWGGTPGGSADFQVLLNTSARAPAAVVAEVTAVFLS